jgi:LmbE family N-acetylglucosaminyl deacetylase
MSTEPGRSILCVGAHPDDVEVMAGGSIARWVANGDRVHAVVLTDGVWTTPDGRVMRDRDEAAREAADAAAALGITTEILGRPALRLQYDDDLVRELLVRVDRHAIDTIVCPWDGDLHHDHEMTARMAVAASRRVPRVLMGQINPYLRQTFAPNLFVDVTATFDAKIRAVQCYRGEWARAGSEWMPFLDDSSRTYGRMVGVARAEGFVTHKFLW